MEPATHSASISRASQYLRDAAQITYVSRIILTTRLRWLLWLAVVSLFVGVWLFPVSDGFTRASGCGTALVAAQKRKRQWIGIDVSPTACRVMAKRLQDVCGIREKEELWKIGRGFIVRDLPWTEKKLRELQPFEFENWAVIALGGRKNKAQVGDMGLWRIAASL